jgi:conjugal transfer mating pair stabilization protein TraN
VCQQSISLVCPTNYSLNGSTCQKAPECLAGGSYNASFNLCDGGSNVCSPPTVLDTASDVCYQAASCGAGTLNTGSDKCEGAATVNCGNWTWDTTAHVCVEPAICNTGIYNTVLHECQAAITRNCGSYNWSSVDSKCIQNVVCPQDSSFPLNSSIQFDQKLDICVSDAGHTCAAGLTWNSVPVVKCEAVPICTGAGIYNPLKDRCLDGLSTCPLGTQFSCMDFAGVSRCSPNACVDAVSDAQITDLDESMLKDDARDDKGNCLGQLYIFNGKASRCRPPGLTVGMLNDCCQSDKVMTEDTGSSLSSITSAIQTAYEVGQVAYYGNALATGASQMSAVTTSASGAVTSMTVVSTTTGSTATITGAAAEGAYAAMASGTTGVSAVTAGIEAYAAALFNPTTIIIAVVIMVVMKVLMGTGCDQGDIQTGMQDKAKQCHYVGNYCYKKYFFGCVQQSKGFCCFNSKMARIIHEQGRPQLTSFQPDGNWGTGSSPNCRGFTPEEFQSLDFSKIDMSEYFDDIQKDLDTKIQNSQQTIRDSITKKSQAGSP